MENSEITTETPEIPEEEQTVTTELVGTTMTETTFTELTTLIQTTETTECQALQIIENINVEQLNTFTGLGISFISFCFFFSVVAFFVWFFDVFF